MLKKLLEAEKKYRNLQKLKNGGIVYGKLYIDHKYNVIKSEQGFGIIYDFNTDEWY